MHFTLAKEKLEPASGRKEKLSKGCFAVVLISFHSALGRTLRRSAGIDSLPRANFTRAVMRYSGAGGWGDATRGAKTIGSVAFS